MAAPIIDTKNPRVFTAARCDFPEKKEIQDMIYAGKTLITECRLKNGNIDPAFTTQWTTLIRNVLRNLARSRIACDIATTPSHLGYISLGEQLTKGVIDSINDRTQGLLPHQKDCVFEALKRNVEYFIYYFSVLQADPWQDNAILRDTLYNAGACGPGIFQTFSTQVSALYSQEGLYFTLAQCRTDITRQLAESYIHYHKISDGMAIHVHIAFEQHAHRNDFNLLSAEQQHIQDDFLNLLGMQDPSSPIYTWFHAEFLRRYQMEAVSYMAQIVKNFVQLTFNQYAQHDPLSGENRLTNDGYLTFYEKTNAFFQELHFPIDAIIQIQASDDSDNPDNTDCFFTLNPTGMKHIDVLVVACFFHLGILNTESLTFPPRHITEGLETQDCIINLSPTLVLLFEQQITRSPDNQIQSSSFSLSEKGIIFLPFSFSDSAEISFLYMDFVLDQMVRKNDYGSFKQTIINAIPFPLICNCIFETMLEKIAPFHDHLDFYKEVFFEFLNDLLSDDDILDNKDIFYAALSFWLNRIQTFDLDFARDCISDFLEYFHMQNSIATLKKNIFQLFHEFASNPQQSDIGHILLFFTEQLAASFFVADKGITENVSSGLPTTALIINAYLASPQNLILLKICDHLASEPSIAAQWLQQDTTQSNRRPFDFLFHSLVGQTPLYVSLFSKIAITLPSNYWHQPTITTSQGLTTPALFIITTLPVFTEHSQTILLSLIETIIKNYMDACFKKEADPTSISPIEPLVIFCLSEFSDPIFCKLALLLYNTLFIPKLEWTNDESEFSFYLEQLSILQSKMYSWPVPCPTQEYLVQSIFILIIDLFDKIRTSLSDKSFFQFADFLVQNVCSIMPSVSIPERIQFEILECYLKKSAKYHDTIQPQLMRLIDHLPEEKWKGLFQKLLRNQRETVTVFGSRPQDTHEYHSMSAILTAGKNAPNSAAGKTLLAMGINPESRHDQTSLFGLLSKKYDVNLSEECKPPTSTKSTSCQEMSLQQPRTRV